MRIVLYNRHFFPSVGGTEMSGRIMARELAALGHQVTVVTATPLPDDAEELSEGYEIVRNEQAATMARLARESEALFSRGGVSLRAFLAAFRGGVPLIVFHESDAAAGRASSGFWRHATDLAKILVRHRARLHVVVSGALRDALALPVRTECFTIYNPVADELWTESPASLAERDLDVVFVGRLVADKGLLVLRDALCNLPKRDGLRIGIAGNGAEADRWLELFRTVAGEVLFLGPVTGDRLRELYARARIVTVPSIVNEGMGMVAAEAIANGVPVCASDQPSLREVIGDAGLFHPMADAEHLALDINCLLDDDGLWRTLSDCALNGRVRFSMRNYRENLSALVDRVAVASEVKARRRCCLSIRSGRSVKRNHEGRS